MIGLGLVYFEDNGRLYINHDCDLCTKFPLEDLNTPCLSCGVSQAEIIELEASVEKVNKAIDLMAKFMDEDDRNDVREAFVHLSGIQLGEGMDQIIFTDIDQNDEIRGLADLTDHMVTLVVYPTNIRHIRHIEGDEYYEDFYEEDDE